MAALRVERLRPPWRGPIGITTEDKERQVSTDRLVLYTKYPGTLSQSLSERGFLMSSYLKDPLAGFTDEDFQAAANTRVDDEDIPGLPPILWPDKYRYDQYNWDVFSPNYAVVKLHARSSRNSGFFAVVDVEHVQLLDEYRWGVHIIRDASGIYRAYAQAWTPKKYQEKGAPQQVYMHRLIVAGSPFMHRKILVDHRNGHGLDNRRKNLCTTDRAGNMGNSMIRTCGSGLPRGVTTAKGMRGGREIIYGYRAQIQRGKTKVYSPTFLLAEHDEAEAIRLASDAYCRMHAEVHPESSSWSENPTVSPPQFPPIRGYEDVPF